MKYKQHLPTYTHAFLEYSEWLMVETEHYIFHYTKDSEAEKDIEHIKARQEQAFQKIVKELGVLTPDQKIKYYFYPTPELKKELMGDDWFAQAIYD